MIIYINWKNLVLKFLISTTIKELYTVFDIVSKLLERERTMYKCLSDFDKIYKNFQKMNHLQNQGSL